MNTILRICGMGVILFGVGLIMFGFGSGPWNPGEQMFLIGHGLASLIVGIGVVGLSKIATYFVFPLALYTFWVMRVQLVRGNPLMLVSALIFVAVSICSIVYLIQSRPTEKK
jgi:hypothetical protein